MKTKAVQAIEYNGRLYHSEKELKDSMASSIIWDSRSSGMWASNPKDTYLKLKEIYENE